MLCSWETCLGEGVLIFFPRKQRILGALCGRTKSGASSHWFGFVHSSLKVAKMDYFRWFKGAPNHVQDHLFALKSSSSDQRLWFTFTIGQTRRNKQRRPSFQKHLLDPLWTIWLLCFRPFPTFSLHGLPIPNNQPIQWEAPMLNLTQDSRHSSTCCSKGSASSCFPLAL